MPQNLTLLLHWHETKGGKRHRHIKHESNLVFLNDADKQSNLKVTGLDYQQTLFTFQKSVLTALQEVQSALDDDQTLKQTQLLNENILEEKQASLAMIKHRTKQEKSHENPCLMLKKQPVKTNCKQCKTDMI